MVQSYRELAIYGALAHLALLGQPTPRKQLACYLSTPERDKLNQENERKRLKRKTERKNKQRNR